MAKHHLWDAANGDLHVPLEKVVALYKDPESDMGLLDSLASPLLALGGTWLHLPEVGDTLPTASNWKLMGEAPNPRWLSVDWFKRSPYSPVRLEAHPDLTKDGGKWRAAFEDLMLSAMDRPMLGEDDRESRLPGLKWMLSLQYRSVLPPLLPRFYSDISARRRLQHTSIGDIIYECKAPPWGVIERPWQDSLTQDFAELRDAITQCETLEELKTLSSPRTELDIYEQHLPRTRKEDYRTILDELEETMEYGKRLEDNQGSETERLVNEQLFEHLFTQAREMKDANSVGPSSEEELSMEEMREIMDALAAGGDAFIDRICAEQAKEWEREERLGLRNRGAFGISSHQGRDDEDHDFDDADEEDDESCPVANYHRRHAVQSYEWNLFREAAEADEERRRSLYRRLTNVLGEDADWPKYALMETAVLENAVEGLEDQNKNLNRIVGEERKTESQELARPDVLSALSTTQTTRLPDGSVTTKVVLKKRFRDGREEVNESVHTYLEEQGEAEKERRDDKAERSGKGWFWR